MWLNQQWQSNSLQLFYCFVFCSYVFMFLLLLFLFVCVFIFCMCVNLLLTLSWFLECHSDHQLDCLHQLIFVCSQCFSVCYTDQCASSMCSLAGKGLYITFQEESQRQVATTRNIHFSRTLPCLGMHCHQGHLLNLDCKQ